MTKGDRPLETVQTHDETVRSTPMQNLPGQMLSALLKMLAQPTLKPLTGGKHTRSGYTKNKMQGESKTRRRMIKASRKRNRA